MTSRSTPPTEAEIRCPDRTRGNRRRVIVGVTVTSAMPTLPDLSLLFITPTIGVNAMVDLQDMGLDRSAST